MRSTDWAREGAHVSGTEGTNPQQYGPYPALTMTRPRRGCWVGRHRIMSCGALWGTSGPGSMPMARSGAVPVKFSIAALLLGARSSYWAHAPVRRLPPRPLRTPSFCLLRLPGRMDLWTWRLTQPPSRTSTGPRNPSRSQRQRAKMLTRARTLHLGQEARQKIGKPGLSRARPSLRRPPSTHGRTVTGL